MKRNLTIITILGVMFFVGIVGLVGGSFAVNSSQPEPLVVEEVQQLSSQNDNIDEVIIRGAGFDKDTRVVLSADVGNLYALSESVPLTGNAFDLLLDDDFVFVANAQIGLQVLKLDSSFHPKIQKTYQYNQFPVDLFQDETRLFMTCSREGVRVYDKENPLEMALLASIKVSGTPLFSQASNDVLYVATGDAGIRIVDISDMSLNKTVYRTLANIDIPGKPTSLLLDGDILFVATHTKGLLVYSVSDPERPELLVSALSDGKISAMVAGESTLYIGDDTGRISLYNIQHPSAPYQVNEIYTGRLANDLTLKEDRLYVADAYHGLIVVDVSVHDDLKVIARINPPGQARAVAILDDHAFIASNTEGLQIVNVKRLESSHDMSSASADNGFSTPGSTHKILRDEKWLYIADASSLQIFNRMDKKAVISLSTKGRVLDLIKQGEYLFLAEGESGISVVDVADPLNPVRIAGLDLPAVATQIVVEEDRLVVASAKSGIYIVDISIPREPRLTETIDLTDHVFGVDIEGGYIYVAGKGGVQIFDVRNRWPATMIKKIVPPWPMVNFSRAFEIVERGGFLYVANGEDGLLIIDARDPQDAQIVSRLDLGVGMCIRVYLDKNQAYVVDGSGGVYLVDISNRENPRTLGQVIPIRGVRDLEKDGSSLLIGVGSMGVREVFKPQELNDTKLIDDKELRVKVPHPERGGRYSLHISNRNEQKVQHGALLFSALNF